MHGRIRAIIVCLLLGLVLSFVTAQRALNAAVSNAATWTNEDVDDETMDQIWRRYAPADQPDLRDLRDPGRFEIIEQSLDRMGGWTSYAVVMISDFSAANYEAITLSVPRSGWPMKCAESSSFYVEGVGLNRLTRHGQFDFNPDGLFARLTGWKTINYRLLPLGLLVNTLFYGAILFLPYQFLLVPLVRRRRIDRRLCVTCRYDLRQLQPKDDHITCPECGGRLPTSLFNQPRQIVRVWMVPLLLPLAALGLAWLMRGVDYHLIRVRVLYGASWWWAYDLICLSSEVLVLFVPAWLSYQDRAQRPRIILSITVAVLLALIAYIPLRVLIALLLQS